MSSAAVMIGALRVNIVQVCQYEHSYLISAGTLNKVPSYSRHQGHLCPIITYLVIIFVFKTLDGIADKVNHESTLTS